MKRFLKKRWLGIPVGIVSIVLLVCLLAGGALAAGAFSFLSFTTNVSVDEPLSIEYSVPAVHGGDGQWYPLGDEDSLTIQGSAGDTFNIDLRINNRANGPLTVHTIIGGQTGYLTFSGFPNGVIPLSDGNDAVPEWSGTAVIYISGNAPTNISGYDVDFAFTRE